MSRVATKPNYIPISLSQEVQEHMKRMSEYAKVFSPSKDESNSMAKNTPEAGNSKNKLWNAPRQYQDTKFVLLS